MTFDLCRGWFGQSVVQEKISAPQNRKSSPKISYNSSGSVIIQQQESELGYKNNHHTAYLVVLSVSIIAVALVALSFLGYFKAGSASVFNESYCKQLFSEFANVEGRGFGGSLENGVVVSTAVLPSKLGDGFVRLSIYETENSLENENNNFASQNSYNKTGSVIIKCSAEFRTSSLQKFYGIEFGNDYSCGNFVVNYGEKQIDGNYVVGKRVVIPDTFSIPVTIDKSKLAELGYDVSELPQNITTTISSGLSGDRKYYYEFIFVNSQMQNEYLAELGKLQDRECPDAYELISA